MNLRKSLLFVCTVCFTLSSIAQNTVFKVENPDYELSPLTGVTRQHWVDAAEYMLTGAFSYINDIEDPLKFPKQEGKSYPHSESRVPTEKLEGLCRTLFVAAPLLKEKPDLELNGIKVAEYYRYQILQLINPESAAYIVPRHKNGGPSQNLVEYGALAISLFVVPDLIWEPLSQEEKDALAANMLSYGDGPTVDSNWKFFNIYVLSFFKAQGYDVNDALLEKYLKRTLEHYRGDGWYNDSPAFDYYSMWAFQLYGALWTEVFGNEHYPEISKQILSNFKEMENSYPYLFARDGKMTMYGRSISYRMASVASFPFMGSYGTEDVNLGWMRHISSATLMQFMTHPDFMKDNVPTLGFYGPFEPAVQNYSCRGSAFWMGKVFLGLMLPEDAPFWTAVENEGDWNNFKEDEVYNHYAAGSEILITNYPEIGASEIRAWCHEKVKDDWQKFRSTENYNRLSYSSAFPWQADGADGTVAMNYAVENDNVDWEVFRLYDFKEFTEGAYHRDVKLETNENIEMNLVDMPLANGILRVDKMTAPKSYKLHLGHYALPQLNGEILTTTKTYKGQEATIIDNGEYQLAMVPVMGWQSADVIVSEGMHPQSKMSSVINVSGEYTTDNNVFITLMLWKKSGEKWRNKELFPIKSFELDATESSVQIELNSGDDVKLSF